MGEDLPSALTSPLNGFTQSAGMGEYLCIGDYLCLYCEETEGYVYSYQSSSANNGLFVYSHQDRNRPTNVPNPHAVVFQVCIQNRYKLNKKFRKWLTLSQAEGADSTVRAMVGQAKMAAEAEDKDNLAEQTRQHGKRVRYGEVVQLKHIFSNKYVHMNTTHTSKKDKNNMKVSLVEFNAKNAQFRILPRYKVKSEGEVVQLYDQIVFESVKSPGHYFHASEAYQIDHFSYGAELNLGVERSSFTLIGSYRETAEQSRFVRGGSVIRLFHKELEAYLVAEGLFDEVVTEDVHFRIRAIDQHRPKSLSPSTSGITYWQIEAEHSILDGDVIRWEQQIRLRHMLTRQYLCIDAKLDVSLVPDPTDPRTVFRLHSVLKERDEIQFESYARIEHVLTSCWLHALKDEDYKKHQYEGGDNERSMQGLRWDGAAVRKVSASSESMYDDAYTIQWTAPEDVNNFNYVGGMVPFLFNLIQDQRSGALVNARKTHTIIAALKELKDFMLPDNQPMKERQKLMRNLRVIDLLVKLLQCPLREGDEEAHMIRIFKEAYDVLHAYMIGKSRKNALYFAKYIDFFQTQFTQKGGIGLNVAQMIVELIRDKRKIVDRINQTHVQNFIQLLRNNQNFRFLDLLQVLCVCDGVAIPNNQTYIVKHWLKSYKDSIYLMERGQNINKRPNIVYVSMDCGNTWLALHQFVDPSSEEYDFDRFQYLMRQLELFKAICFGRNDYAIHVITREQGYVTWEDTFLCLQSDLLPDAIRAKFCELIIGLFVDVGNNYSVLDNPNICFVYEYVGSKDYDREQTQYDQAGDSRQVDEVVKDLVTIFPVLRDWLADFLSQNCTMTASMIGRNLLIEQVLRLLHHLVKFGYYMDLDDVRKLLPPLLSLLDGRHDVPYPKDKGKGYSKDGNKAVAHYRATGRFERSPENEAIVNAKYQAMEVLDLLLTFQRNQRLKVFVTMFKQAEQGAAKRRAQSVLEPLLYETYNPADQKKKALKKQRFVLKELREMFHSAAIFDIERTTAVLMDLSEYSYDKMVVKSLDILNKMYSSQHDMFTLANKAQVLLTNDSARVHREVQRSLPTLRRLARAKLNDQQVALMSEVLDELCEFCHLPKTPDEPHHMNQNIMISHGVLNIVLDILSQEIESKLIDQYAGMETVFRKTLFLLKLLIRENHKVQDKMFDNLDQLLDVQIVRSDLAVALKEIFIGNQATCLKVHSRQVQRMVLQAAESQQSAPEFLELLRALVKVEGLDLTIKRNQALVMKYIMQNFKKAAYVLDQPRNFRENILTKQTEQGHLTYFINLVDLLATCAEGENKFIESLCQTIVPVEELLWVMTHTGIDCNLKRPFLHFMLWVYMKTTGSNLVESGAADLQHDKSMWDFIHSVTGDIHQLIDYLSRHPDKVPVLLKNPPPKSRVAEPTDTRAVMQHILFYVLDGVLPFLHVFYTVFYCPDKDVYTNEVNTTESMANALIALCDLIGGHVSNPQYLKNVVMCLTTVVSVSSASKTLLVSVLEKFTGEMHLAETSSAVRKGNMEYYSTELELNAKFHTYTNNCMLVHSGHNTVQAQLKIKSKREYTARGTNDELPLGEEFQNLVRCFINPHEKKPAKRYAGAKKLIEQLWISAQQCKQPYADQPTHAELDVRCLQVLRAIVHNEERRLADDWAVRASEEKIKKQLHHIKEVQVALNGHSTIIKVLPHLARRNDDIVREVLAFICIMLFNANRDVQKSMLEYFLSTREEVFFMAVRDRMQISTNAIKEKTLLLKKTRRNQSGRSLLAQHEARVKEAMANMNNYNMTLTIGRKALQQIQVFERKMKSERLGGWRALCRAIEPADDHNKLKRRLTWRKSSSERKTPKKTREVRANGITFSKDSEALMGERTEIELTSVAVEEAGLEEDVETALDEGVRDMLEYKDDGYIELVLKVLARICDGQHVGLQNYLREQPDNVKTFNIVGETAQFLNVVYTTINSKTIDLVIQLFNTLNEFCSGNQENRVSVYDKKVIDYINFILRAGEIADCPIEKVIELQQTIGALVVSLIEENGPGASQVAKEVKDALDKEAVCRCMTACYEMHQAEKKKKMESLTAKGPDGSYLQSAKTLAAFGGSLLQGVVKGKKKNALKESVMEVGFTCYLILARMMDIDPHVMDTLQLTPEKQKALDYYKKNSLSIEVVKDDILQKVNFRVKNKSVLREEVKEKLKWNVDRTSPTNKIRDLMSWTSDIMKDISYQRKILDNPIAKLFTKGWLLWNYGAIILSLAINIIMLWTWNAKACAEDSQKSNITAETCPNTYDPSPNFEGITSDDYRIVLWALGGVHNLFSLFVLISYFLSNHPRLPRAAEIKAFFRGICGGKAKEEEDVAQKDESPSKLHIQFFSFTTFYYLMFLGMSIMGTLFHGYFFAFHLLNVVNNNQLLSGVIKAVTLNGMSLLWVAVLGFIVIYIYSLIGFALLRAYFKPDDYLYCKTLFQCTVTVIRYGLIGDMFEEIKENPQGSSFESFWPLVVYHVSFFIFITTIGLNIIFGIIVDTFSELRDLKWRAESDMKDTCFICSRNSYDFEHHGKGFDWHVRHEHNMWAYIYFIMHLDDIQTSDYTALELYVAKLMEKENYEFIPLNRALCLSSVDIDSTESKIDDLLHAVTSIAKKQREDEAEKKRKVEKLKQRRWQEKHRRFIFGVPASEYDTDRDPLLPVSRAPSMDRFQSPEPSTVVGRPSGTGDGGEGGGEGGDRQQHSQASLARFLAPPPPPSSSTTPDSNRTTLSLPPPPPPPPPALPPPSGSQHHHHRHHRRQSPPSSSMPPPPPPPPPHAFSVSPPTPTTSEPPSEPDVRGEHPSERRPQQHPATSSSASPPLLPFQRAMAGLSGTGAGRPQSDDEVEEEGVSDSDSGGDTGFPHREGSYDLLDDDIPQSLPPPPAPILAPPPLSPPYTTASRRSPSPPAPVVTTAAATSTTTAATASDDGASSSREKTPESFGDSEDTGSTQL
ncbi:inositol 1,4,5-trisphosphate-gated calcium channel ITPR1-like isoform X2 [Babylonia areolata]|uniref:inositol 1,4,5-trisphosphate-gated calcium channel ITPR1-like isoform X2 n=1 Tax=Babylonia areolata TaxID=304850 RepID=UPI003FD40F05